MKQRKETAPKRRRKTEEARSARRSSKHRPTPPPAMGALKTCRVAVSKIKPATYNPRIDLQPGSAEYEKLKRSIARFGYVDPLVWNKRSGNLIGGHQRLKILINEHGVKFVDVAVVSLSDSDERALNIALNKVAGDWDDAKLATVLAGLQADAAADETLTGFETDEIDALINAALQEEQEQQIKAVEIKPSFAVLVNCKNEVDQRKIYETMEGRGYRCKVLTI